MKPWTEDEWTDVLRLRDKGVGCAKIGSPYGLTKNAVQGRIYRRLLNVPSAVKGSQIERPDRRVPNPYTNYRHLEPSRTPFAPDHSCPDFAWDDEHCGAVLGAGGYPVIPGLAGLRARVAGVAEAVIYAKRHGPFDGGGS